MRGPALRLHRRRGRHEAPDGEPADDSTDVTGDGVEDSAGDGTGRSSLLGAPVEAAPEPSLLTDPGTDADDDVAPADRDTGGRHADPDDHSEEQTPGVVVGAVALGTVPVPFLVVYAGLFLMKGLIVRADRPEITGSHTGEALAGLVALVFLIVVVRGLARLHAGAGVLLHLAAQLVALAAGVRLLVVSSSGDPQIPVVVVVAALASIGLTLSPRARAWTAARRTAHRAEQQAEQAEQRAEQRAEQT